MDEIPNEIGTKICSYLPLADRVRLGQIIPSWITWAGLREIVIDDLFSSDAAVIELLEKCGGQLEEITSQQNLPQTYGGKLFGHFCPKLRNLSFTSASSFCFTELPNDLQRENFHNEIDRLFSSLTQLKRLEILQPIKHWNLISDGFLSAAG